MGERRDDVLDEQRRLEVGERDRFRARERGVQIAQLERFAPIQHPGELHVHLAAPLGACLLLFVDRDPFGEPPRHALIRHLERDDVRQFVGQQVAAANDAVLSRIITATMC